MPLPKNALTIKCGQQGRGSFSNAGGEREARGGREQTCSVSTSNIEQTDGLISMFQGFLVVDIATRALMFAPFFLGSLFDCVPFEFTWLLLAH